MLDAGREYSLQQTLDEHSSSITAVKFAGGAWETEAVHPSTYHLVCWWGGGGRYWKVPESHEARWEDRWNTESESDRLA